MPAPRPTHPVPSERAPRRRDGEHGQILILFTLVIVVIMGLAAIVVDAGMLRTDRSRLQTALDAAALAAGQSLPANATNQAALTATAIAYTKKNFNGLPSPTVAYACTIGVDAAGLPRVSDMPTGCNVSFPPTDSNWRCTGAVCWAPCTPASVSTDVCNTITLAGSATRNYLFGPAIGVNSGNTGTLNAAACTGLCGSAPSGPVDAVVLLDRTGSMDSSGSVGNLRAGGLAVLEAFDPKLQRVALGFTGPTSLYRVAGGSYGSKSSSLPTSSCTSPNTVNALALRPGTAVAGPVPTYGSAPSAANASGGAATLVLNKPSGTIAGSFLLAAVTVDGGSGTSITAPSGWNLVRRTNNGTNVGVATYSKFASAAEPSTYSFALTTARATGGIIRYSGVDTGTPIDVSNGATGGSGTAVSAPTISTATANTALIAIWATDAGTSFSGTPSGYSERFDQSNSNAAGPTVALATSSQASTGATGSKTSTAGVAAVWAAQQLALRAVPGPVDVYGTNVLTDIDQWVPLGFTGTDSDLPAVTYNEAYVDSSGTPDANTNIVQALGCFDVSAVGTNLARPLYMAVQYLADHGRPGVKQGIILETDGAPNNGGYGPSSDYTSGGVQAAADFAKSKGIELFTIGYGVDSSTITLLANMATGPKVGGDSCLASENTDGDHFFCQPTGGDLRGVLRAAAAQLSGGTRLVQLYPQPLVIAVSPATGTKKGGTTVAITGRFFTEAYSVTFGGSKAASFTVVSDTLITAVTPAGPKNVAVDVQVSTPGGSSNLVPADKFTYGP